MLVLSSVGRAVVFPISNSRYCCEHMVNNPQSWYQQTTPATPTGTNEQKKTVNQRKWMPSLVFSFSIIKCVSECAQNKESQTNPPTHDGGGGRRRVNTYLSILIAHKLRIDAVHSRTSNEIHISHSIHPSGHDPRKGRERGKKCTKG